MNVKRLHQIEEIYHAVLELPEPERDAFFTEQCGADIELRREVESLLGFEKSAADFLDAPPERMIAEVFGEKNTLSALSGKRVTHYKIIKPLGKGGMGEVFLAEDVRLSRPVALKCLRPEFSADKDRMRRFVREAKTASALNHPNIITIYEISKFKGIHFMATEFIDGQTLNQYAQNTPLEVEKVLEIAIQIVSALDEAHSAGIIHRDIKPENIMIRPNGLVKILDFGIAKLAEKKTAAVNVSSVSMNRLTDLSATQAGAVLGTANYMSPEQAKGEAVDARTDIFSFGMVFYELLAGKSPFEGGTAVEMIDAILNKEPKLFENDRLSFEIEEIVNRCLRKDRDERYQTAKDIFDDLQTAKLELTVGRNTGSLRFPTSGNEPIQTADELATSTAPNISATSALAKRLLAFSALAVLLVGGFFGYRAVTTEKQIKAIAVLPFVNESGSKDVEYLSDGMTENLIGSLSSIPQISVKARSTVFTYKDKTVSAKQVGEELNVDAVLLGRVIQQGDQLKVNLELVETSTQNVLWTQNYERKMNRLVALESEIASNVSENLRLRLTKNEQTQIAKTYTTNSEARRLYLKGRFHWNKRTKEDFEKAAEYFKQAVEKDPQYAPAYVGLADTYALMPLYGNFRPHEYKPLAKQAARRALEIDSELAEAHASLGYIVNSYDFDWESAEREYKTALKLNPNYATARQWYAEHLAFRGRTDEALAEIAKALELEPFSPVINRMKGNILVFGGRFDEAIEHLQKTVEMFPENSLVRFNLGDAFAAKEMYPQAVEQYLIALRFGVQNASDLQNLETAYKKRGWSGFWLAYLEISERERVGAFSADSNAYFNNEGLAYTYAMTGNREKTLEFLAKAFEERDPNLVTLKTSKAYEILSDDPRYKALLKNIGLPE